MTSVTTELAHREMVAALAKPGDDIFESLSPQACHLLHMLLGITGEVGELVDGLKKAIIYEQPLDRSNIVEELGDIEFYLEGLRQGLRITREETLTGNMAKLSKRYANLKYTNEQAKLRADKEGEK